MPHSYQIQRIQALKEPDFLAQRQFCYWFGTKREEVNEVKSLILFTDDSRVTGKSEYQLAYMGKRNLHSLVME